MKILKKMKKVLFFALLSIFLGAASINAQVKIGSEGPPEKGAILDLNGTTYVGGLLLPNVEIDDLGAIPLTFTDISVRGAADAPELAGLLVWNTRAGSEGVYMWDGHDWKLLTEGTGQPPLDCSAAPSGVSISGFTGTYNLNAELAVSCNATTSGVTLYTWNITDPGLQIVSGQGTNRIIVKGVTGNTYAGTTISCVVQNSCGAPVTVNSTTGVTINPCAGPPTAPTSITFSPNPVNVGQVVTASSQAVDGASSYVWQLPDGLSATTVETTLPSLSITASAPGSYAPGLVSVRSRNVCGVSAGLALNVETLNVAAISPAWSTSCRYDNPAGCTCISGSKVLFKDASTTQLAAAQTLPARYWHNRTDIIHVFRWNGSTWVGSYEATGIAYYLCF